MTSKSRRERRAREAQQAIESAVSGWFAAESQAPAGRPFGKLPGWTIVETEDDDRTESGRVAETDAKVKPQAAQTQNPEPAVEQTQTKKRRKRSRKDAQHPSKTLEKKEKTAEEEQTDTVASAAKRKPASSTEQDECKADAKANEVVSRNKASAHDDSTVRIKLEQPAEKDDRRSDETQNPCEATDDTGERPAVVMPPEEEERRARKTPQLTAAQLRCQWERERWEAIRSEPGAMELYEEAFERSFQKGSCERFAKSAGMKIEDAERLWDKLREGHCDRVVRVARGRPVQSEAEARDRILFLGEGASDVVDTDDKLVALEDRLIEEAAEMNGSPESQTEMQTSDTVSTAPTDAEEQDSEPEPCRTPTEEAEMRMREEQARREAYARQARESQERFSYLYEAEEDPRLTKAENQERLRRSHERRQQAISAEFAEDERLRTLAATADLEARFLAEQQSRQRSRWKQRLLGLTKVALVLVVGVLILVVSADTPVMKAIGRWGSVLFETVPEVSDADDFKKDDRS